jgi:hypothetical protein
LVWDANTQQIFSIDELCIANNIYEDDDLNCMGEPTLVRPTATANPDIAITARDVQISQHTPDIYRDSDSVSTFNTSRLPKTIQKRNTTPTNNTLTSTASSGIINIASSTPDSSVSITPPAFTFQIPQLLRPSASTLGGSPDGSISKLSGTASRLSAFDSRFDSVTQSLSSALQLLQDQSVQQAQAQKDQFALMAQLLTYVRPPPDSPPQIQLPTATPTSVGAAPEGIQLNASPAMANQPTQESIASGPSPVDGTAGSG